jgi:hypothetical protein
MASHFGWRSDRNPVPYMLTMPKLTDVLGSHGIDTLETTINVKLVGHWRGAPITALQITTPKQTNTMLLVPRQVPGPNVVLTRQGLSWTNFLARDRQIGYPPFDSLFHVHARDDQAARSVITPPIAKLLAADPRTQDFVLFFGPQHLAALFPGVIVQPQVVAATADLLVAIGQQRAHR